MENYLLENFGITPELFNYLILPLLIFLARVADVSIATIRVIFVMTGKRRIAPILGFFEALIWLLAIGQIFQNIDNWLSYIAYAGGFATGTYVGMYIEEKLALGRVVVRVITAKPADDLVDYLREKDYRFSSLDAIGKDGKVNVIFMVVKRDVLPELIPAIKAFNPNAFYSVEGVKKVSDEELIGNESSRFTSRLLSFKRR